MSRPEADELLVHAKRLLGLIDSNATDQAEDTLRVPVERYRDADWFDREIADIFRARPMPVALGAELAEPGSYVALTVVGVPLLITRDDHGVARVLVNSCRHRGSRLVGDGCGRSTRFTCPYHAWSYDRDGALVRIPGSQLFGEIDPLTHSLTPLPSEERHGVVFAVLDPAGDLNLDSWLVDFEPELARLALGERHVAWTNALAGPNWKICADGYTENYHFPFLHPDTISVNNLGNVMAHDAWGQFQRILMPRRSIEQLREATADVAAAEIASHWATVHYLFPNTMLSSSWGEWTFVSQIWPGADPGTSTTRQIMLCTEPVDADDRKAMAGAQREAFYAIINGEDYTVGRGIQAGLGGGGNTHFTFGRNEVGAQHLHRWVERMVEEAEARR